LIKINLTCFVPVGLLFLNDSDVAVDPVGRLGGQCQGDSFLPHSLSLCRCHHFYMIKTQFF